MERPFYATQALKNVCKYFVWSLDATVARNVDGNEFASGRRSARTFISKRRTQPSRMQTSVGPSALGRVLDGVSVKSIVR